MTANVKTDMPKKTLEPRRYQLELLDYVEKRNGIIFLPTGAGKTYVAIMALRRFSKEMQETIENGGKRAVFMCNTVELARQQAIAVKEYTNLKVGFYVGERDVDSWSRKKWDEEIRENQVLVGTAQIFLDIVTQNYIKITNFSIVIIDECHHATKNHPMHEFNRMLMYVENQSQLPRVIGLTGVLLKGNKLNKIREELESLEATFRGKIVTVNSKEEYQNVMLYSTQPTEQLVTYGAQTHCFQLVDRVKSEIKQCFAIVDHWDLGNIPTKLTRSLGGVREPSKKNFIKNLLQDFIYQMDEFGLYTAAIAIMSPIIEFELKKRQAETMALRKLYRYVISRCELIRHMLVNELKEEDTDSDASCHTQSIIFNFATPKLRALLQYMQQKFKGKQPDDIRGLVFVERRYTAKSLYYVLQKFIDVTPELTNVVRPQFMIGRNTIAPGIESILERKWCKTAIEKFRTGECNFLICSSVLEEGIDIQACNYVFAYDPLKTFNSYVQTKGRARSSDAFYVIFAPKIDEVKVVQQIKKYKETHAMIQEFLLGRILDCDEPSAQDVAEQFVDNIPPFVIPSGACLLASSALKLLHRYCQQLPADAFGGVTPWFSKQPPDANGDIKVLLQLPLQSNLKETIMSDAFKTTRSSMISAAFKACVKLYELGELNDKLLPVTKRECVANVAEDLFEHWKKFNDDVTKKAGKQQVRLYPRKYPEELYGALPKVGEICYAYEIKVMPHFELNDYTKDIDALLKTSNNYAILLRKRLPPLAEMPLFMNQGKMSVKICEKPVSVTIASPTQLDQLRKYHLMLFRDMLECWKSFFVLDQRNRENTYLLVPLANGKINWNLVENFQRLLPQRRYSISERQKKVYRVEDYLGKVVTKWYSGRTDERFVVTKVLTDMTPQSAFDNDDFNSYIDFIDCKYKDQVGQIVQPQQFMLEVRPLTTRRNFFINAVGKTSKVHRNQEAIRLIPELCHNYMYPGDMWAKALLLPSILHRLHFMLHAEELRKRINQFLGIESPGYRPKPLSIDESLRRVVDSDGNATEEVEEPKKLLPALPTKPAKAEPEAHLLEIQDITWKEYMEPADYSRDPQALFPVEIDYYYKFITGLALDLEALKLAEEETWTHSQLAMSAPKQRINSPTDNLNLSALSISDVPLVDKLRIDILERSLNKVIKMQTAEQAEFLAAITTAKANDVFDMERFEFLGDSFLKFSVSLYLANKYPTWHEGFLTEIKSKLVSNRNLVYCMLNTDIPERVCLSMFKPPHEWLPPLISLPSNLLELLEQDLQMLSRMSPSDLYSMEMSETEIANGECTPEQLRAFISKVTATPAINASAELELVDNDLNLFVYKETARDKVVADTLEALLGVCVKNYGIYHTFRMLEFFGVCKPEPGKSLTHLMDLKLANASLHANISTRDVDSFLINYQQLEANLGYKFRDRAYLLQALTHPSYPTNRITGCYQELEFIGDAILDFLVSCFIFERYKHMTPGMMTDMRSALVNNITLGCVCVRHRFHLFLLAENSVLSEAIRNFTKFQELHDFRVTDQVHILMEENVTSGDNGEAPTYNISTNVDVPKALGDILEALIAAVYLDCRDIRTTWSVIYHLLEQEFNQFAQHTPVNAVRQLNDHKYANPKYSDPIIDNETVMVKCQFTCLDKSVEVNGFGVNSKQAKLAAAKHALQILAKYAS